MTYGIKIFPILAWFIQYMKQFFYDFSYRIDKFSSVSQEIYDAIENGRDKFIQIIAPLIENFAALT